MYIDFTMNNTEVFSITDSKQDEWIIGDSRLACGAENTGLSLYTLVLVHMTPHSCQKYSDTHSKRRSFVNLNYV